MIVVCCNQALDYQDKRNSSNLGVLAHSPALILLKHCRLFHTSFALCYTAGDVECISLYKMECKPVLNKLSNCRWQIYNILVVEKEFKSYKWKDHQGNKTDNERENNEEPTFLDHGLA